MIMVNSEENQQEPKPSDTSKSKELDSRINELIKQLGSNYWKTREKAQKELEEIGEPAEALLKKAIESQDIEIRMRAKQILKVIINKRIRKQLRFSMSVGFLEEFHDLYLQILESDNTDDRFQLLMKITSEEWLGTIREPLTTLDEECKYRDIIKTRDIATLIGFVILGNLNELTVQQKRFIIAISQGRNYLRNYFEESEAPTEEDKYIIIAPTLIDNLGWDKPVPESIPYIMKLLDDSNKTVRLESIFALANLGAKEVIPELIKLLKDNNERVRYSAVSSLAKLGAKESIPAIIKLLKDNNLMIQRSAILAIGKLKVKKAIPEIRKILSNELSEVRGDAALALAQLEDKESIPEIISLLKEPYLIDVLAAISLVFLGAKDKIPSEQIKNIIEEIKLLKYSDEYNEYALSALKSLGIKEEKYSSPSNWRHHHMKGPEPR
jgi:HEAT repeat protein